MINKVKEAELMAYMEISGANLIRFDEETGIWEFETDKTKGKWVDEFYQSGYARYAAKVKESIEQKRAAKFGYDSQRS